MNPRNAWFAAGFLAGGLLGAAVALLYAPARGQETLAALRDHVARARAAARDAGRRAEADVLGRYKALRAAAGLGEAGAPAPAPAGV
jgi:gas vesicle protein